MALSAILTMIGLGMLFAVVLAAANQRFKVEEDPRIERVAHMLPGLNCGVCGFPNCHEFAKAIVEQREEAFNAVCRAASADVMDAISEMTGIDKKRLKEIPVVFCGAKKKDKTTKAVYKGIETCRSANLIFGGGMNCEYGCLGFGDCMEVCPFGAIKMEEGLPKIDLAVCVNCGKCIGACPRNIIEFMPDSGVIAVTACRSKDKGAFVRKICSVGCIACRVCEKLSGGIFVVEDNLSRLRTEGIKEGVKWDEIINKCPTSTIVKVK